MKYRPSPLNILAVIVTIKYLVLFINALNGLRDDLGVWVIRILQIVLELFIPLFFLGIDYGIQLSFGKRKYVWGFLIELAIITTIGLVLYYGYDFRTLYQLSHSSIFDMMN